MASGTEAPTTIPADVIALIDEILTFPSLHDRTHSLEPGSYRTLSPYSTMSTATNLVDEPTKINNLDFDSVTECGAKNDDALTTQNTTDDAKNLVAVPSGKRKFTNQQRVLLTALCALNFCGYMCYAVIAPFFPHEVIQKGGNATWTGLIFACYQLVMFVMAPVFGRYIEVIGARFMLTTGPFIVAWCSILFGFLDMVPSGPTFLVLAFVIRMVEALGAVMFVTVSMSIRPMLFPGDIAFVYAVLQTCTAIGLAVGPALGGFLYEWGGYGLPFWTIGGIFLALDALLFFILPDFADKPASTAENQKEVNMWQFFKEFDIVIDLLTYSVVAFAAMFYDATISLHIFPLVGSNAAHVGFIMFIVGVAECVAAPLSGIYQDRGGSSRLIIICGYIVVIASLVVMGPTPLLPFLHTTLLLVIIGTVFYGIGLGFFFAAPYKEAVEATIRKGYPVNQRTFGVLAGCFQASFSFGAFVGPAVGGFLQDQVKFRWAATIVAGVVTLLFVMVIGHTISRFMQRRRERSRLFHVQGALTRAI